MAGSGVRAGGAEVKWRKGWREASDLPHHGASKALTDPLMLPDLDPDLLDEYARNGVVNIGRVISEAEKELLRIAPA